MNSKLIDDFIKTMPLLHVKFFHGLRKHDIKKYTRILMTIAEDDGHSMSYYGEKMYISKPNFSKAIDELIKQQLVERRPDEKDRRKTNIYITENGKKEAKKHMKFLRELIQSRFNEWEEDDLKKFHEHILGINEILEKV